MLPESHYRYPVIMGQADTIIKYDTMRYSRLELESNSLALKIPKIDVPRLSFLEIEKVDTIYKDNVMYLTYPRGSFYTKMGDAEIWHSGIDCTIDSLNIVQRTQNITESRELAKKWRFELGVGIDVGKGCQPYITPNLGAEIGFKRWAITGEVGCSLDVQENNILVPSLYYQVGLRYSLIQR